MAELATPLQWYDAETLEYCPGGEASAGFELDTSDEGVTNGVLHGGPEGDPDSELVFFARSSTGEVQVGVDDGGTPEDPEDDTPIYEDTPQIEFLQLATNNGGLESQKYAVAFGGLTGNVALSHNPWDPLIVYEATDLYDQNGERVRCCYVVESATPDLFGGGGNLGYVRVWARLPKSEEGS